MKIDPSFIFLNEIKDNLEYADYNLIYQSIVDIKHHALPTAILHKGWPIDRVRINKLDKSTGQFEIFTTADQVNYIHDKEILENFVTFGRANEPKQAIFYGAVETKQIKEARVTAYFETSEILKELSKHNNDVEEIFTLSRWRIMEDIEVVEIIFGEDPLLTSEQVQKSFEKQIKHLEGLSLEEHYKEQGRIFGNQFARNDLKKNEAFKYKISAAYSNFIFKNTSFKGITYPSVNAAYKGQNVALLPEVVDKCLKLEIVGLFKYGRKNGLEIPMDCFQISTDFGIDNMDFKWVPYFGNEQKIH